MRPQDFEQEELFMMLQDVLTSASAGHTEKLRCPVCEKGDLDAELREDGWVRIACPQCKLEFEGLVANPEETYEPKGRKSNVNPFG